MTDVYTYTHMGGGRYIVHDALCHLASGGCSHGRVSCPRPTAMRPTHACTVTAAPLTASTIAIATEQAAGPTTHRPALVCCQWTRAWHAPLASEGAGPLTRRDSKARDDRLSFFFCCLSTSPCAIVFTHTVLPRAKLRIDQKRMTWPQSLVYTWTCQYRWPSLMTATCFALRCPPPDARVPRRLPSRPGATRSAQ